MTDTLETTACLPYYGECGQRVDRHGNRYTWWEFRLGHNAQAEARQDDEHDQSDLLWSTKDYDPTFGMMRFPQFAEAQARMGDMINTMMRRSWSPFPFVLDVLPQMTWHMGISILDDIRAAHGVSDTDAGNPDASSAQDATASTERTEQAAEESADANSDEDASA